MLLGISHEVVGILKLYKYVIRRSNTNLRSDFSATSRTNTAPVRTNDIISTKPRITT